MELIDKADIICQYFQNAERDETYNNFIKHNDLGIPLSLAIVFDLADIKPKGVLEIENTWENMCSLYDKDPKGDYESIEDLATE